MDAHRILTDPGLLIVDDDALTGWKKKKQKPRATLLPDSRSGLLLLLLPS